MYCKSYIKISIILLQMYSKLDLYAYHLTFEYTSFFCSLLRSTI